MHICNLLRVVLKSITNTKSVIYCLLCVICKETAVVNEFTMMELFYYFGLLYHMKLPYTRKRVVMLKAFLGLPTLTRKCGALRYAYWSECVRNVWWESTTGFKRKIILREFCVEVLTPSLSWSQCILCST